MRAAVHLKCCTRALCDARDRRWRTEHASAVTHAIPIRARLLHNFCEIDEHRDRVLRQPLRKGTRSFVFALTDQLLTNDRGQRRAQQRHAFNFAITCLRGEIDLKDPFDFIAEEINSKGRTARGGMHIQETAAHREVAWFLDTFDALVASS